MNEIMSRLMSCIVYSKKWIKKTLARSTILQEPNIVTLLPSVAAPVPAVQPSRVESLSQSTFTIVGGGWSPLSLLGGCPPESVQGQSLAEDARADRLYSFNMVSA